MRLDDTSMFNPQSCWKYALNCVPPAVKLFWCQNELLYTPQTRQDRQLVLIGAIGIIPPCASKQIRGAR
jgi:hypothetical protein